MAEHDRRLGFLAFFLVFSFIVMNVFRELLPGGLFTARNGWKFWDRAACFLEVVLFIEEVVQWKPVLSIYS